MRSKSMVSASLQDGTSVQDGISVQDELHADMRSDAAILSQLRQTDQLIAYERIASEQQQQALVGLQIEDAKLAARLGALERRVFQQRSQVFPAPAGMQPSLLAGGSEKPFLCSSKTGGTCRIADCDDWREKVKCDSGSCVCEEGICADGHGRCREKKKGRILPDTYKISFKSAPKRYLYADEGGIFESSANVKEDPGKKGEWNIVVNNDNTVMLYVEDVGGTDRFLHVEEHDDGENGPTYHAATASFNYPQRVAFQPYKDDSGSIFLKDVRYKKYLYRSSFWFGWFENVHGASWTAEDTSEMIFKPPLDEDEIKILKMASSRVQASLLTVMCIFAHLLIK